MLHWRIFRLRFEAGERAPSLGTFNFVLYITLMVQTCTANCSESRTKCEKIRSQLLAEIVLVLLTNLLNSDLTTKVNCFKSSTWFRDQRRRRHMIGSLRAMKFRTNRSRA